jgi:branched-chain amino acid transport system substrate-binding protein
VTNSNDESERHDPNRREFLRNVGLFGAAAVAGPAVLAACGSSSKSTTNTTAAGGTATTAAGGTATTAAGGTATTGAPAGDVGTQLAALLQIDEATAAKGKDFPLASVLALTGPGSFYGKTMSRGIDLAVKHIAAAGGPNIKVKYWDHKSGDAAAGKTAITEIVAGKYPAKLASYVDDLGAMLEDTAKNKVFTLDGGGGTSIFGQGIPYFWGTRAITPNDVIVGQFLWFKENYPDKKTVGLTGWDIGEPNNTTIKTDILKKIADAGLTHNGLYELTPVGSQDYSAVFPKIKANQPDLILLGLYGQDIGSFINQAETAGLTAVLMGEEFTPDGVNASKGTFEKGYLFGYDYFDANSPVSPLAKLFVEEFKKEYGGDLPDFYAANFYENTLVMWEMIRRVEKKGGNILSGEDLNNALLDNLTFVSVYGGDASTVGTSSLDPKTHSVLKRGMGIFKYQDGKVTPLAFYGIGGEGYKKA